TYERSSRHLLQRALDLGEHFVLAAIPVDRDEISACAVVLDQRLRLTMIVVEPPLYRLVGVIRTAFDFGATAQPVERDLVGNLERERDAEVPSDVIEHRVERLRLHRRSGKAVEDEARLGVGLLEPVAD